ncbi:transposable element Tcb2 transposase [Trichonephila clavipes]|nr:transposable element Tcb2 transposase [Trichonephila clavipes]
MECHCLQFTVTPSIDQLHHDSPAYVYDILQLHVLPHMAGFLGTTFQQDNARPHTARISPDCLRHIISLLWPARPPDLSPTE